ncbi:hypothetical protein NMG60_11015623 [Bertholletia excelsa]
MDGTGSELESRSSPQGSHSDLFEDESLMELASGNFSCAHHRRCKIRVPCSDEIFECWHDHNEAKNLEIRKNISTSSLLSLYIAINPFCVDKQGLSATTSFNIQKSELKQLSLPEGKEDGPFFVRISNFSEEEQLEESQRFPLPQPTGVHPVGPRVEHSKPSKPCLEAKFEKTQMQGLAVPVKMLPNATSIDSTPAMGSTQSVADATKELRFTSTQSKKSSKPFKPWIFHRKKMAFTIPDLLMREISTRKLICGPHPIRIRRYWPSREFASYYDEFAQNATSALNRERVKGCIDPCRRYKRAHLNCLTCDIVSPSSSD